MTGNAKPSRRDLLDCAIARVFPFFREIARWIFASLSSIALTAKSIHRNGERLVRLLANRSVRHRASLEMLYDLFDRLNFLQGNWPTGRFELHQTAQGAQAP